MHSARADLPQFKAQLLGCLTLMAFVGIIVYTSVSLSQTSLLAHDWKWYFNTRLCHTTTSGTELM